MRNCQLSTVNSQLSREFECITTVASIVQQRAAEVDMASVASLREHLVQSTVADTMKRVMPGRTRGRKTATRSSKDSGGTSGRPTRRSRTSAR
jgi:hypothetical protein